MTPTPEERVIAAFRAGDGKFGQAIADAIREAEQRGWDAAKERIAKHYEAAGCVNLPSEIRAMEKPKS